MANLMVGRELSDLFPPKDAAPTRARRRCCRCETSPCPAGPRTSSFEVRPGEILGFAGLVGAGRTELFEGLLGLRRTTPNASSCGGRAVRMRNPRDAADHGLTYLSEDRKGKGLHVDFGLRENLTLMALARYARPWLQPDGGARRCEQAVETSASAPARSSMRASSLSGGNQQKLALAKVLQPEPRVVVLDEPTRGVDVGAKRDIYFLIQQARPRGAWP